MQTPANKNLAAFSINRDNGSVLNIYLEPINHHDKGIAVYALYRAENENDSLFNHLSIPAEIGEDIPGLDDINQKEYLGEINLQNSETGWEYEGTALSVDEQQQVATHLENAFFN